MTTQTGEKAVVVMSADERAWFDLGVEQGWLKWYSTCSGHGPDEDESCARCKKGSWGVYAFNGVWAEPPASHRPGPATRQEAP